MSSTNAKSPKLERLEDRLALATVAFQPGGKLVFFGAQGNDFVKVEINPANHNTILVTNETRRQVFDHRALRTIEFHGYAGNDNFANFTHLRTVAYGHAGEDILTGGFAADLLYGGPDRDTINGLPGNDRLEGGPGTTGNVLFGGEGNDTIIGDDGDDLLFGFKGNDRLEGRSGNDQLSGFDGHDVLFGEAGNDIFTGGTGNDILTGGDGDDILNGEGGFDRLYGGAGKDTLDGGIDGIADLLVGGADEDRFRGELFTPPGSSIPRPRETLQDRIQGEEIF